MPNTKLRGGRYLSLPGEKAATLRFKESQSYQKTLSWFIGKLGLEVNYDDDVGLMAAQFDSTSESEDPVTRQGVFKEAAKDNLHLAGLRVVRLFSRLLLPVFLVLDRVRKGPTLARRFRASRDAGTAGEGGGESSGMHATDETAAPGQSPAGSTSDGRDTKLDVLKKVLLGVGAVVFGLFFAVMIPVSPLPLTAFASLAAVAATVLALSLLYVAALSLRDLGMVVANLFTAAYYGLRALFAVKGFDLKIARAVRRTPSALKRAKAWVRDNKLKVASAMTLLVMATVGAMYAAQVDVLMQGMRFLQTAGASLGLAPALTAMVVVGLMSLAAAGTVYGLGRHQKVHGDRRGVGRELAGVGTTVLLAATGLTVLNVVFPAAAASLPTFSLPLAGLGLVAMSVAFRAAALRTPMPKLAMPSLSRARAGSEEEAEEESGRLLGDSSEPAHRTGFFARFFGGLVARFRRPADDDTEHGHSRGRGMRGATQRPTDGAGDELPRHSGRAGFAGGAPLQEPPAAAASAAQPAVPVLPPASRRGAGDEDDAASEAFSAHSLGSQ